MGFIYLITNTINNKYYIGQTLFEPESRWHRHKYCASVIIRANQKDPLINTDCSYYKHLKTSTLYNSMAVHGIDNFTFEVLEEVVDLDLNEAEKRYIQKYNSKLPNGYNATDGGDSKYTHTEEAIQKMVESKLENLDDNRHEYLRTLPPRTTYSQKLNAIILVGHPLCKYKMFPIGDGIDGLENAQEAVINFVEDLELNGVMHVVEKKENDLKDYPGLKATKKGYKLEKYINGQKYQAGFESQKISREERKQQAKDYYDDKIRPLTEVNNLLQNAVQRLNVGGGESP